MPLDARPLHEPPRRLTKISKKNTQFPVSSHVSSEVDVPRPADAAICRKWLYLQVVSVQYLFTLLSFSTTT